MKSIKARWAALSRGQRIGTVLGGLALLGGVVAVAAYLYVKRPGDKECNPCTPLEQQAKKKVPPDRTVDWPRYGYDVERTKFLDTPRVKPPFKKVWKYDDKELVEFAPIVADGALYGIDNDGVAFALDADTGKEIWRERHSTLNASSPAYQDGVLYSVSLEPAQVIAVRARDGKVLWKKDLPSRAESSPLVVRKRMYFGTEAGTLFALDLKDGDTVWETQLGGAVKAAPAFDDGTLYVGDYSGKMSAVKAADGDVQWQTQDLGTGVGSGRFYSTAAVAFGRVYAGDVDGRVYSFDQKDGGIVWTFSAGNYVYSGIAAGTTKKTKPTVYFGSHDKYAYAVDAEDGDLIWKAEPGGQVSGPATVIGPVVYISTFSGDATSGFNIRSGRTVFKFDEGEYGPAVSDGEKLYVVGGTTVTAYDPVGLEGKYEAKKGQKGIIPPKEYRRLLKEQKQKGDGEQQAKPKAKSKSKKPAGKKGSKNGG